MEIKITIGNLSYAELTTWSDLAMTTNRLFLIVIIYQIIVSNKSIQVVEIYLNLFRKIPNEKRSK